MSKLVPIKCNGLEFPSVAAMCTHFGVERFKTHSRIQRGWTPEEAVGLVPKEGSKFRPKEVTIHGVEYPNMTIAAASLGVKLATVKARIEDGYSVEDAFIGNLKPRTGTHGTKVCFEGKQFPSIDALG